MTRMILVAATILALLTISARAKEQEQYCTDTSPRDLTVEMYPFVPNAEGMALWIKENFEAGCKGLHLIIHMNGNYYSTDSTGILGSSADVYEVDSVFFEDFLKRSPKPPSPSVIAQAGLPISFAKTVATHNGTQIGVPHWVCSDFLFYPAALPQFENLAKFDDVARELGSAKANILMDIKGGSTLGELYLSILVSEYGSREEALRRLALPTLDDAAVDILRRTVTLEPAGFGRDQDYHYRDGFYPRQFAYKANSSIYVGYSEDTYYVLTEAAVSCPHDKCLDEDKIQVTRWPFSNGSPQGVAWVDMYFIDQKAADAKLRDAEAFIKFMMSAATYLQLLFPTSDPSPSPRYLLPARDDLYANGNLSKGKLYPKFRALIDSAIPITAEGLNARLHDVASQLEKALPAAH